MLFTKHHLHPVIHQFKEEWIKKLSKTDWTRFIVLTTPFMVKTGKAMRALTEAYLKAVLTQDRTLYSVFVIEPFADGCKYHSHLLVVTTLSAAELSMIWKEVLGQKVGFSKSMFRKFNYVKGEIKYISQKIALCSVGHPQYDFDYLYTDSSLKSENRKQEFNKQN